MERPAAVVILVTVLVLAGLVLLSTGYAGTPDKDDRPLREFEDGKLYKAGNSIILRLSGSYGEMGRQYGG